MGNILITSAGRRVSLVRAFVNELKHIGLESKVFITDMSPSLSAAAHVADEALEICRIDNDLYIDSLLNLCIKHNIKLVIPTIDTELLKLSKYIKKFNKANIHILLSNESIIKITSNKLETHLFFREKGLPTAKIYQKDSYELPLYIKPIKGSSSLNNYIIKSKSKISKYHLENKSLCFFEYLDHDDYDEYTCDMYYDKTSILKCVVPRKRIEVRGGEVSKGLTIKNEIFDFVKDKFSYLEGARGCLTLQLFMHKRTKDIKGIEINPRFGGGFPLSYFAGANYPRWIINEYFFNKKIEAFDGWKENLLMLRYDHEILVNDYKE
ncbi:carbamoyl-phosphate synthase large subunit [Jejuia pallidilutea]|uniref:Carbamoyl-phosphate synthase large subunit n=1 Tax=Jejuia pallidilutea TaxID=504487 RepID=A0A362X1T5_9FLAO|nr:ATP-grasp domain-containing protein [Jejuia pallidilutea]PQV50185.1 carbamoyl-phosphate synthase large subunit [Jejuia pallidilutea]